MGNPEFRKSRKGKGVSHEVSQRVYRNVENRNEFLSNGYRGANGIKTGMTMAAGECLVASAERDGQLLIAAVYDDEIAGRMWKRGLIMGSPASGLGKNMNRKWRENLPSISL